ncbi:MAG: hypothetical protein ACFFDI_04770 [Promethearchaeota archaeon]
MGEEERIEVRWFRRVDNLAEFKIVVNECPVCGDRREAAVLIRVSPEYQAKHVLPKEIDPLDKLRVKIKCDRDNCPYKE